MITIADVRRRIDRLFYGDPCDPSSAARYGGSSVVTSEELGAMLTKLRTDMAIAEHRRGDQVLYCPRCAQHLPARVFGGHVSTVWTKAPQWPPNDGFTPESIEYMGPAMMCPGGS